MTDSAHAAEPPEPAAAADDRVRASTGSPPDRVFDHDRIRGGIRAILEGLGLDPDDPVVQDTPERFARMCDEVFAGLLIDPRRTLDVVFEEGHDELIMERDIPVASMCVPSAQHVNAVAGVKRARDVGPGELLWTFDGDGRLVRTEVVSVRCRRTRDMVRIRAGSGSVRLTPEHPVRTRDGWKPAGELRVGDEVQRTHDRRGERPPPRERDALEGVLGAVGGEQRAGASDVGRAVRRPSAMLAGSDGCADAHGLDGHATWTPVESVERVDATTNPYTVHSFQCHPYPTFLVGGVLTHNCEHHLLPFFGRAHVGYLPNKQGQITGVSKLARLVDLVCKRPNLQERITTTVADVLEEVLEPRGVICIIEAEHMCMSMRGVKKPGAVTVTSAVRGAMRESHRTREEAMTLALGHRRLGT